MDPVIQFQASDHNGGESGNQIGIASIASAQGDTTGSELGEPLIPEAQERISAWMRRDTLASLERLREQDVMASKITSNESLATEVTSTSATVTANDDFGSDDEELEIEMAQKVLALGRQQSKRGEHAQSEAMLRRALAKTRSLGTKDVADLNTKDITYEIAAACFEQSKLDETQQICEGLINELPNDDADRARMLDTSHLLAQVHLRKAAFDPAIRQCKQTIKGRRRLDSGSPAYHDSLALLVTIHEANEDEIEAMAYASLLPEGYQRPTFKGPVSTAPQPIPVPVSPKIASNHEAPGTSRLTAEALRSMESLPATSNTLPTPQPMPKLGTLTYAQEAEALEILRINSKEITSERSDLSETLFWAASQGHDLVIRLLLQPVPEPAKKTFGIKFRSSRPRSTVTVNTVDNLEGTPLHWTAAYGQLSTCRLLLQHGASPLAKNVLGRTPLHSAAANNQTATIELLLGYGVDVDVKDNYSQTPLCRACMQGHTESVEVLIKRGAKVTHWVNETLRSRPLASTPLHYAAGQGHEHLLPVLYKHGADLNARSQGGLVPLHYCAMTGQRGFAKKLITLGANSLLRTTVDTTLIDPKIIPTKDDLHNEIIVMAGCSMLHFAARSGHEEFVAMLLDMGSEFATHERTDFNSTPLMMAARNGRLSVVELLIKRGANLNAQDRDGHSVSHFATSHAHWEVAERLARAGVECCACYDCNKRRKKRQG